MIIVADNLNKTMQERYYQGDEKTPQQMISRVARYVADGELLFGWNKKRVHSLAKEYYDTMNAKLWMPSSPFLMNAGTKVPMLSACFVVGGLNDDLGDIYNTLSRQGIINKMGGGTGFNFSDLREEGAPIGSTGGTSSGVMSFMRLFNENAEAIKQGGRRRSANMGILNVYHPEILKFIDFKLDAKELTNFNISVLIDDAFMEKVKAKEDYQLVSPTGREVGTLNAYDVFMRIMTNQWRKAEPSIIWVDSLNKDNPVVKYLGYIVCTNPCGEVTLYWDEACNLASINLDEMVGWDGKVDWEKLRYVTKLVTRFLDTSIDVNVFPDEKIKKMVNDLRRLGIGIMGLHGALIKKGLKYSSQEGRDFAEQLMEFINACAWDASRELAEEKGVFPLWEHSDFGERGLLMRNVALTTIAPTGTISQILDASAGGGEPMFAVALTRIILLADLTKKTVFMVNSLFEEVAKRDGFWSEDLPEIIYNNRGSVKGIEQVPVKWQELFETAMEISAVSHVRMQASLQKHVDNSISKTINMPENASVEDVAEAYMLGWELGLKGMTIYREGSREESVLSVGGNGSDTPELDVQELKRGQVVPAPEKAVGETQKLSTGCGNIYLTMNRGSDGSIVQTFVDRGSQGTCQANQVAVSRLISLALRGGISVDDVVDQLLSIPVCPSYYGAKRGGKEVSKGSSCPSALAYAIKDYVGLDGKVTDVKAVEKILEVVKSPQTNTIKMSKCPKCGENGYKHEGGCGSCIACGYSRCD